MADNVPKVVEAERFVLRDRNGRIRAALTVGFEADDLPRFANDVRTATPTGYLIGSDGGPSLLFFDEEGTLRARLSMWASGGPTLELGDDDGIRRIMG